MGTLIINEVFTIVGIGVVVVARIIDGMIREGDEIIIGNKAAKVKSIEKKHKRMKYAVENELVGIALRGVDKSDIKRGRYTFRK